MKKTTDLEGVKNIAKVLLMTDIHKTPLSPMIVQHPFTSSGFVSLPKDTGHALIDITADSERLGAWQSAIKRQIDKTTSPYQIYLMINKPYGLSFLKFAEPYLSRKDYSEILAGAWIMCEAPHNNPDLSLQNMISMFKSADPRYLMDENEYETFQALDETVTVYRGVTPYNADNVKALSWTLDQTTAEWFAHRFDEKGTVYEAQINK